MGLLSLLGLGSKGDDRLLVVVTNEGSGRFRLNGNRAAGKRGRAGAAAHDQTVGWIEFAADGRRLEQGLGPAGRGDPVSAPSIEDGPKGLRPARTDRVAGSSRGGTRRPAGRAMFRVAAAPAARTDPPSQGPR